jgi:hypothetical protein
MTELFDGRLVPAGTDARRLPAHTLSTVSATNHNLLYGESVLRRSDSQSWSHALAPVLADTINVVPGYERQLRNLNFFMARLCDELRAHQLPSYAFHLGPSDWSELDPMIFGSYLVSHRAERLFQATELAAGGLQNLERRSLQMAVVAARALFECAVASRRTHQALLTNWRAVHGDETAVTKLCSDAGGELWHALHKIRTATRIPSQEIDGWESATSVLTNLNAVTKGEGPAGDDLRDLYDRLCDAAHPNVEANAAYWRVVHPDAGGRPRVALAPGNSHSALQADVVSAVGWSLGNIIPFSRDLWWAASELSMAERFPALATSQFGLPRPTGRNEPCCCGSGLKTKNCDHPESPLLSEELPD